MTRTRQPVLSVVVPSVNGWHELEACLTCLEEARRTLPCEVLVADRCGDDVRARVADRFPDVRILPMTSGTTIPAMRAMAFAAATAPTVAVIEDHVHVATGWMQRILDARAGGHRIIGGRVENAATETIVDWAAFYCEYSAVMSARAAGAALWLTGNNVAYDASILHEFADVIDEGRWENHLHDACRRAGIELWYDPALVVGHRKHYAVARAYGAERFTYSRAWAAMHLAQASITARGVRGAASLMLPPVLLTRIARRVWRHRAHRRRLLLAMPYLCYFAIAWALGESVGAWFGDGGALASVR